HNFIRLWAWDSTVWHTRANGRWGKDFVHYAAPQPWLRTGPGTALDGKPTFDLTRPNPVYFERLRERVGAAGERRIYVSVMLFEGWGMMHANLRTPDDKGWAWRAHPFHPANNVNGTFAKLPADALTGPVHTLDDPVTKALQADYIRRVVDTVNDLDNVLYEVINEGGEPAWDRWVVETVREYERTKPKQHPIGITGHGAENVASMLSSPADWISPGRRDGYGDDPPAWDGPKVSLLDTDHVWGIGGNVPWAWKAFLRGHNPLFMDPYDGRVLADSFEPKFASLCRALGDARRLAGRLDLARMTPRGKLCSTGYCLADMTGDRPACVAYLPKGGKATLDLSGVEGTMAVEWIDPDTGEMVPGQPVAGGAQRELSAPFGGHAVVYVRRERD
ncbi:MAG: hypothetical protein JXR77_08895, partial [Lentisphaeria bacterium]|nr:hypothetical protein [Lentisphaeria bacterium]